MEFLDALEMLKIDSEVLFRRFSGNKSLAERFIRKFRDEKTFMELKKAYEAYQKGEDTKTVMELQAHTLKGVAANLEFIELYKACTKMVDHLREKRTDTIDENYAAVETEYMKLINVLKEL